MLILHYHSVVSFWHPFLKHLLYCAHIISRVFELWKPIIIKAAKTLPIKNLTVTTIALRETGKQKAVMLVA